MNFFYFCGSFLPSWIRIRIRIQITDPDPDPMVRLNTDPIPIRIRIRIRIRNPAGIDSRNQVWNWVAKLHRQAGRYDNPMPTWFLAPIVGLKLPTQTCHCHMLCVGEGHPYWWKNFQHANNMAAVGSRGWKVDSCVGNFSPAVGVRNQVGPPAYIAWLLNSRLGSWNRFHAP